MKIGEFMTFFPPNPLSLSGKVCFPYLFPCFSFLLSHSLKHFIVDDYSSDDDFERKPSFKGNSEGPIITDVPFILKRISLV